MRSRQEITQSDRAANLFSPPESCADSATGDFDFQMIEL